MEYKEFEKIFKEKENEIQLDIPEKKIEKLYQFMKILLEWNEKINLTSITLETEIIEKHFIDSLTIMKYIKDENKVIDVGTGAGFPGVPLAINTDAMYTLLDSLNKRINYLNIVKDRLDIKNIETIHGRAEDIAQKKEHREMYDVAISRAVAPMNILVEYLLPFVKVGGICICMKGPNVGEELEQSKKAINILGGSINEQVKLKLNNGEMERNLIVVKKIMKTEKKYPRKAGTPAKQPL